MSPLYAETCAQTTPTLLYQSMFTYQRNDIFIYLLTYISLETGFHSETG